MTGRQLNDVLSEAILQDVVDPVTFVRLGFDGNDLLLHDRIGEIIWGKDIYDDDEVWLGVGNFGQLEHIEETTEITNLSLRLILTGLSDDVVQEAVAMRGEAGPQYYRRPVTIYYGIMDPALGTLKRQADRTVPDPDIIWSGFMDVMEITVSGDERGIILTAENEDVDFERPNGKLYSNAQQQEDFEHDRAFEYLESQAEIVLRFPDSPRPSLGRHRPRTPFPFSGGFPF